METDVDRIEVFRTFEMNCNLQSGEEFNFPRIVSKLTSVVELKENWSKGIHFLFQFYQRLKDV